MEINESISNMEINESISNINIKHFQELIKPDILISKYDITKEIKDLIIKTRNDIQNVLLKLDNRKIIIVGPCSIHNINEAKEYAEKLVNLSDKVKDKLIIVMRVYFEKPRSTIGWKGLINDPDLDNTFNVNKGLELARELLLYINSIGLPCACEFLDVITPQYISDLISWGAIGARTTESQVHRQLVSGLSMPVGFKNGTKGSIDLARDAIISASHEHCFMSITNKGEPAISTTYGNKHCHLILRGGITTNYSNKYVNIARNVLIQADITPNIMIDCSHGNSNKDFRNQKFVFKDVIQQIKNGESDIIGLMLESNINQGRQNLEPNKELRYGVSITDSCISFSETEDLINYAYKNLPNFYKI